ncbi:hypothetical protein RhiirA4_452438 [Rhizophagus irregularis]|uniref:Uncharacterized protein n=1 Tax=Rhizophagus irregularis TaxID=588596 RepID=A0A2I1FY71_9GLOM|nr:hypothetical protein RhiirA4_452438 [Rhizophagus irregularis]
MRMCLNIISDMNLYFIVLLALATGDVDSLEFYVYIDLSPIKNQIINGEIDWSFTKEWLNHNPLDVPCSAKLSKIQGTKIKKCNFIYPSIDIQQRNYPRLYPLGSIPCIECQNVQDSNAHIGTCTEHSDDIKLILNAEKEHLFTLIADNLDNMDNNTDILEITINNSPFLTSILMTCYQFHILRNSDPPTDHQTDAPTRRLYTHRRLTTTPYFREGGFYDNDAHIRWTSCNFCTQAIGVSW